MTITYDEATIAYDAITWAYDGGELTYTTNPVETRRATGRLSVFTARGSLTSFRASSKPTSLARVGKLGTPLIATGRLTSYTARGSLKSFTATGVL